MSIFKKDCPECAASNSVDAVRCRCGYCFDPEALAGADADAYEEEQSRLYHDYLAARIVQAEAELTVAREQAKADPANTYQAAAALVAEQALNALQAEMQQLSMRLVKRPSAPAPTAPIAPRMPAESKSTPHTLKPAEAPPVAAPSRRPDVSSPAHTANVQKPRAVPSVVAKPAAPEAARIEFHKAAAATAPARKVSASPHKRAVAATRREPARTQPSPKPGANFRTAQARKAEAIAKSRAFAPVAKVKRALSSVVSVLTSAPAPAASAAAAPGHTATRECPGCTAAVALDLEKCRCGYTFSKAAEEMPGISLAVLKTAGKEASQECPSCTATVPVTRERCNCGYTFAKSTEHVPALTLDAAALAILTDGIKPNLPRRR